MKKIGLIGAGSWDRAPVRALNNVDFPVFGCPSKPIRGAFLAAITALCFIYHMKRREKKIR